MFLARSVFTCTRDMILSTYISGASNLLYNGFWLILDLSSFIGQNLVNQVLVILSFTSRLLGLIITLLRVIYKDSVFFFQDLTENFSHIIAFVVENILNVRDGLISFSSALTYGVTTLPELFYGFLNFLSSCFSASTSFIKAVLILLWDGLLLIGSSFWLAVMNTPWGIFYCVKKLFKQLTYLLYGTSTFFEKVITALLNGVQNIFNFIYDVPYSSVLGSVLTIILLYLFIKNFKRLCILAFKISVAFCQYMSSLLCTISMGYFFQRRNSLRNNDDFNMQYRLIEDKLCVICQDRLKEVIVMPCRHLCLCVYCKRLVIENHRVCPICRTNIEGMMKVYI